MSTPNEIKENISKALDIKDDLEKHGVTDGHTLDGEDIYDLTKAKVDAAIEAKNPKHDQISKALDIKEDLSKNGVNVPPGESIWREELEKGIKN